MVTTSFIILIATLLTIGGGAAGFGVWRHGRKVAERRRRHLAELEERCAAATLILDTAEEDIRYLTAGKYEPEAAEAAASVERVQPIMEGWRKMVEAGGVEGKFLDSRAVWHIKIIESAVQSAAQKVSTVKRAEQTSPGAVEEAVDELAKVRARLGDDITAVPEIAAHVRVAEALVERARLALVELRFAAANSLAVEIHEQLKAINGIVNGIQGAKRAAAALTSAIEKAADELVRVRARLGDDAAMIPEAAENVRVAEALVGRARQVLNERSLSDVYCMAFRTLERLKKADSIMDGSSEIRQRAAKISCLIEGTERRQVRIWTWFNSLGVKAEQLTCNIHNTDNLIESARKALKDGQLELADKRVEAVWKRQDDTDKNIGEIKRNRCRISSLTNDLEIIEKTLTTTCPVEWKNAAEEIRFVLDQIKTATDAGRWDLASDRLERGERLLKNLPADMRR